MSPALEEKLAFTATLAGSYEAAAQVAGKWGSPVDDSVIHALVQRVGGQARAQIEQRLKGPARESEPQRGCFRVGLVEAGWLVCAFPWSWLGQEANQKRPRRMA